MCCWSQIPLQKGKKRAHMSCKLKRKDVNALHTELGHPLEEIILARGKAIGHQLTDTFEHCKACAL